MIEYDTYRPYIIELKIIWHFIQQVFQDGRSKGSYNKFLSLREESRVRTTLLFPRSKIYTRPTPAYRPVSSAVGIESLRNPYSVDVTPDTFRMPPAVGIQTVDSLKNAPHTVTPDSATRYEASYPRMVFPPSELSECSAHKPSARSPSNSSLYLDRYTVRASTSYVPPYAKSSTSEHTPV